MYSVKKRDWRPERNRPNLKTPAIMLWRIQPGNRIDGGETWCSCCSWKLCPILHSKQERFSNLQVFLPPSLQGTIDAREIFILAQIKNRFWSIQFEYLFLHLCPGHLQLCISSWRICTLDWVLLSLCDVHGDLTSSSLKFPVLSLPF